MARLSLENAPIPIRELLRGYEFATELHREHVRHASNYNVALAQVKYGPASIRGMLVQNDAMSAEHYGQTTKPPCVPVMTNIEVSIALTDPTFLQGATDVWAFGVRGCLNQDKKRADAVHLEPTSQSLIIPHPEKTDFSERVNVELFAGGYGGWSWAKRHAISLGAPSLRTISVEHDMTTALQHVINHPAHVFPSGAQPPLDLLSKLPGDYMFVQGVEDVHWKRCVALCRHEFWTVSASCQSWSAAGHGGGFNDPRGMTMPHALAAARIFRPRAILFEQVKGFRNHPDFPHFLALLHWAGYYSWHEEICQLSEICPIRRPRFLAVYLRPHEDWDNLPKYESWGDFETMYPMQFGSWLASTAHEMREFTPQQIVKDFYMHPELFPAKRAQGPWEHRIFQSRVPGVTRIQPVAMAQYGQQHLLDLTLLRSKGLHGFFCPEQGTYRWFKPNELTLMHLHTDPIVIWKPAHQAWKMLGNMIALPHSLLQIVNMWKCFGVLPPNLSVPKVFARLRDIRLQADIVETTEDAEAWFLATPDTLQQMQEIKQRFCQSLGEVSIQDFVLHEHEFLHMWNGKQHQHTLHDMPTTSNEPHAVAYRPMRTVVHNAESCALKSIPQTVRTLNSAQLNSPDDSMQATSLRFDRPHDDRSHSLMEHYQAERAKTVLLPAEEGDKKRKWQEACPHTLAPSMYKSCIVPFMVPGEYGKVYLHETVTSVHLVNMWHHEVILADPQTSQQVQPHQQMPKEIVAFPLTARPENTEVIQYHLFSQEETCLIMQREGDDLTAMVVPKGHRVAQIPGHFAEEPQTWYDEYGETIEQMAVRNNMFLSRAQVPELFLRQVQDVLPALTRAQMEVLVPAETDILVVTFHALADDLSQIQLVWQTSFPEEWLKMHGRRMHIQRFEEQMRVLFVPGAKTAATPLPVLQPCLELRLARTLLQPLNRAQGVLTVFKHECRHLLTVTLANDQKFEDVFKLTKHAFFLSEKGTCMSLIAFGKRVGGEATPQDLIHARSTEKLTVQIRHSLWGGGGNPGSKKEHHHMLHTELASMFHDQGFTVQQTPDLVEKMLREYGTPKMHHLLFRQADREAVFSRMCDEIGIVFPEVKHKASAVKNKFQKLARQEGKIEQLEVKDYTLQTGFFLYEDGMPAAILNNLNAWTRGVLLIGQQQAAPWLAQSNQQSPDEFALFIPSDRLLVAQRPHRYVQAPALGADGRQVLLGGTLLQLGEKEIMIPVETNNVPTCPTQICTITMWREDFPDEIWSQLVQAPVKFAKQTLGQDLSSAIINPWGRSYKRGKETVPPLQSESVQFHCEVVNEHASDILRISG